MQNIKTPKCEFTITLCNRDFDEACRLAYNAAIRKFKIDESGHCKDRETFPRNSSSLIVDFISLRIIGGMGGQDFHYKFSTFMECDRND